MAFNDPNSVEAASFWTTWKAYEDTLNMDCSKPCEMIDPLAGSGFDQQHDADLTAHQLCNNCGMSTVAVRTASCSVCSDRGQETVACCDCIPQAHLEWVLSNKQKNHWRCKRCKYLTCCIAFQQVVDWQ